MEKGRLFLFNHRAFFNTLNATIDLSFAIWQYDRTCRKWEELKQKSDRSEAGSEELTAQIREVEKEAETFLAEVVAESKRIPTCLEDRRLGVFESKYFTRLSASHRQLKEWLNDERLSGPKGKDLMADEDFESLATGDLLS